MNICDTCGCPYTVNANYDKHDCNVAEAREHARADYYESLKGQGFGHRDRQEKVASFCVGFDAGYAAIRWYLGKEEKKG